MKSKFSVFRFSEMLCLNMQMTRHCLIKYALICIRCRNTELVERKHPNVYFKYLRQQISVTVSYIRAVLWVVQLVRSHRASRCEGAPGRTHPPPERTEGGPSHRAPRQLSTALSLKAISQNEFISSRTYINHTLQIYFYLYF